MSDVNDTGIYEIVCLTTGKKYIGSAASFIKRWGIHLNQLRSGTHHSKHLQRAWDKYGEADFSFKRIAYCEFKDLIATEQKFLDEFQPEFNVAKVAGSTLGVRYTEESRVRMSEERRGKKKEKPVSDETRAKLSAVLTGRVFSPEHLENMKAANKASGAKRVVTDELRAKYSAGVKAAYASGLISKERPPEYRAKIAATLRGKTLTPEHRANVSAAMMGKKRGPYNLKSKVALNDNSEILAGAA